MDYKISDNLSGILQKLKHKDKVTHDVIIKKIYEIVNSPDIDHYKNLKYDLKDYKEVHIRKSFVLVFKFDIAKELMAIYIFVIN